MENTLIYSTVALNLDDIEKIKNENDKLSEAYELFRNMLEESGAPPTKIKYLENLYNKLIRRNLSKHFIY